MKTLLKAKMETALPGLVWRVVNCGGYPVRIKERGAGGGMGRGVLLQSQQGRTISPPLALDAFCDDEGTVESDVAEV